MPSTTSSSVATAWLSSTVMTPSLPTLSIASAIRLPICSLWLEIDATWATSSWPFTGTDSLLISATTASTALSIPIFSCIGFAPAVTLRKPSLIMVCARRVAVVVPSPATSLVFVATSRRSCAPVFSMGSLSSISRTIVTPSLVTVGAPNFFSRTTLRPLGPSVMRTAWATVSMPFLRACLASTSNVTVFAIYTFPSCLFYFLALPFDATIASTSFSDTIRYSMSSTLNSLPAYLAYSTLSPTLSSIGTLVPLSRSLPVPTASTMPSWGFSLAVSGITIPLLVRSSLSTGLSTTRSPSGFRFMCDSPQLNSVSTPRPQALSTRQGRLLIVLVPSPREGLNLFGRHSFCVGDQVEGAGRLGVRDHDPGLGEVNGRRVGGIAENLGGDPVRLQDGGDQVGLEPLAAEDHLPALDTHQSHPRDGSSWTEDRCRGDTNPAAAIMAALSVQSSRGGMARRALPPTTSAARLRSRVLAATPPATTTSATGSLESAASSFSSSDSTTECSKAA